MISRSLTLFGGALLRRSLLGGLFFAGAFLATGFFAAVFFAAVFFAGTLAPDLRASLRPIAMACLRLFTAPPLPPLPDLSSPFLNSSMTFVTFARPLAALFFAVLSFSLPCISSHCQYNGECRLS